MEDEHNVDQVGQEDDGGSIRMPIRRHKRFEGIKTWWEVGHASTSRRSCGSHGKLDGIGGLDLKTIMHASFPIWASKLGVHNVQSSIHSGGHVVPSHGLLQGEGKS